jgi:hypothetical protein
MPIVCRLHEWLKESLAEEIILFVVGKTQKTQREGWVSGRLIVR